jgi:protein-disulfide isomerase
MASRTKQKEEARARRIEEERIRSLRARRDRRIRNVVGIVLVAVIVVVVAVVVSSGGAKKGGLQTGNEKNSGIPQSGARLGNPNAPVTMTYFGDYECPVCQAFTLEGGFPQLVQNDVRSGKVQVLYKSFCTATCNGPGQSVFNTQQVAGLAAGEQNKFWQYTELFYHEQGQEDTGYVNENYLTGLANQVTGLNLTQWQSDRSNPNLAAQVASDGTNGQAIGVQGTPTLIFKGPKGQASPNASVPTYAQLQATIKQVS